MLHLSIFSAAPFFEATTLCVKRQHIARNPVRKNGVAAAAAAVRDDGTGW